MKIAVWHNLPSGGGKRALYYHIEGLVKRGHTLEAWCPPTADQTYLPLNGLIAEHVVPLACQYRQAANPLVKLVQMNPYRRLGAMDRHCRQCAEEIHRGGFDVLFANACQFYRVVPIARYTSLPKLIYLQEPNRELYEARPRLPWAAPVVPRGLWRSPRRIVELAYDFINVQWLRVLVREEWLNAQAFDMILVNSLFSRENVLRTYGLDSRVCYLGVDTEKFVDQCRAKENFIVGLGAIVLEKNIHFVLESLARVHDPRPRLVWIGNVVYPPSHLDALVDFARSAGVGFEIKLRIDDCELVDILNRAQLMVFAPRLEPFGLVPLEANACGTPVVAVAEGGVRETVIDGMNGLLVEHNPQAMATAIEKLLHDQDYAHQLGQNGRQWVAERWSLEAATGRLEGYLENVIDRKDNVDLRV